MLIDIKLFAEDQSEFDSPKLDSPISSSSELEEEPVEGRGGGDLGEGGAPPPCRNATL